MNSRSLLFFMGLTRSDVCSQSESLTTLMHSNSPSVAYDGTVWGCRRPFQGTHERHRTMPTTIPITELELHRRRARDTHTHPHPQTTIHCSSRKNILPCDRATGYLWWRPRADRQSWLPPPSPPWRFHVHQQILSESKARRLP